MGQVCYHCNEPVLCQDRFTTKIDGRDEVMCCPGCQAVSAAIIAAGLSHYYRFRTQPGQKQAALIPAELNRFSAYDLSEIQQDFVHQEQAFSSVSLTIEGITCAACAWLIEHHLSGLAGIERISVNTATRRALVHYHAETLPLSAILQQLSQIGYQAAPYQANQEELLSKRQSRRFLIRLALAGFATMQVMMFALALYSGYFSDLEQEYRDYFRWVSLIFAAPVVFYSAVPFYFSALRALLLGRVNMDLAVSLAICGAYLASVFATIQGTGEVYFESVTMFTFFLLLGRYFEQQALQTASVSASNLHKLVPLTARVMRKGKLSEIPAGQLQLGDIIHTRPGEALAADGVIIRGHSSVNEAMLTGEQQPVTKQTGDTVYAGTINLDQRLEVEVTALGQAQLVAGIIRLQESASHTRPKLADRANRLSGLLSGAIILLAGLTYLIWFFLSPSDAFWISLSVLVATCPCALALATPTAITCATAQFTRMGLLIRNASVFEQLPKLTHVVLDKTGTLTCGQLEIDSLATPDSHIRSAGQLNPQHKAHIALLNLIANLEAGSLHPIAKACEGYFTHHVPFEGLTQYIGQGLAASLDQHHYRVGHFSFACPTQQLPAWRQPLTAMQQDIWLSRDGEALCQLCLSDTLRPDAAQTVTRLQQMGINVLIASGDHSEQVSALAEELGVQQYYSALLPEDKLALVRQLQHEGKRVAMFGDGINDSPVLAGADISIAMGSGTSLAHSSADAILLGDHLSRFTRAIRIAKRTQSIIKQNFYWAVAYNLLILPLAVTGHVYPYIAALGMSASSLIVVCNSLRLLRQQP
ncbi:copper-translocating P-type ATPase [Shewanella sp. NFH-SH190041]|uniref:heavy metal translocating P-type ATPase n=1 Tax=Shewanella sp. NFH-SH190041 TaxID=2950245 RepID=UPI0021C2D11F|nr:heavy metal translocating P-type ATPase [Shewanella sp. NFH-SH190041]BDM64122.1 copper-translocating P-type ATPase [Shewanella sp. NFH-SH190041]